MTRTLRIGLATITGIAGVLISSAVLSVVSDPVAGATVTWGSITTLPGPAAPWQSPLYGASCTAIGVCTAVGYDSDSRPIYVSETGGAWGTVIQAPGLTHAGALQSVSCTGAGTCTAVGYEGSEPTYATETAGVWGSVTEMAGSGGGGGYFWGVSCTAAGSCTAVGQDGNLQPIYATESGGVWGVPTEVGGSFGNQGDFRGVSCTGTGACVAVGYSSSQPIYATETGGVWGPVTVAPAPGNSPSNFMSVSCVGTGECTAVGEDGNQQPIYATETGGVWGSVTEVPGSGGSAGYFMGVSCIGVGTCTAVGDDGNPMPIIATETGGSWTPISEAPAFSRLYAVSCVSTGNCAAVGNDSAYEGAAGWTLATPTSPTITNVPSSGIFPGGFTASVSTTGDGATSVTSSTTSVCTVTGFAVGYVGVGICTLTAHVAQGTLYAAADGPPQSFSVTGFSVATSSLPSASLGTAYGPVSLTYVGAGQSTNPYTTTVKWKRVILPKGLKLSSAGVLSGTPSSKLSAGQSSVTVQATETVTTLNGTKKVKTKTTAQAAIPLTIT